MMRYYVDMQYTHKNALHYAAENGSSAIVELLLRDCRFSNINARDTVCIMIHLNCCCMITLCGPLCEGWRNGIAHCCKKW